MGQQPVLQPLRRVSRQVQAQFGTAPQDILCRARPFIAAQVVHFRHIQAGQDFLAHVGQRGFCASSVCSRVP
jgi:hypothetical protein